jgi:diguanylate cyclase (GGDEF)-like protein
MRAASLCVIVGIAVPVLLGWMVPVLGHVLPNGWNNMKANAAALVLLTVASLLLTTPRQSPRVRLAGQVLGGLIFVFAGLIFLQFLGIEPTRIDTLLAFDPAVVAPGRIAIQTAVGFMLLGLICGMLGMRHRLANYVADGLTFAFLLYFLSIVGAIFLTPDHLPAWTLGYQLAPETLVCLTLLLVLVILRRTEGEIFNILVQRGMGGRTARLAAPAAILLPFFITGLRELMVRLHILGRMYAMAVAPAITATIALFLVTLVARKNRDIEHALHNLSFRDELTGLYNRRGFNLLAEQALHEAKRTRSGFCIVFLDVDNLKRVNDTTGHEDGSRLLKILADELQRAFRTTDIIGRLGGDEFAVAAKTSPEDIRRAIERLHETTQAPGLSFSLTFSYGVASMGASDQTLTMLIEQADARMYEVKRTRKLEASAMAG